ncbi:GTPase HflX [Fusobacterium perfoetens]|uniref:GTPase HflX n=1 Tax=Fusobacterium perfoetens TaxID=852 RepID=UPI000481DD17|nr:GTPase HflX [Fusobacterium perfoetens]MCI6151769.1 GTPase HflX [Fusobacterium perfoetens]MDY3236870.1 GTPase HflX [Fusobacterium perfoetens]
MIGGNIQGVKDYLLKELENLFEEKIEKGKFLREDIILKIVEISTLINKEISIAIDRNGKILDINIGDSGSATLPKVEYKERKLCGIRIIHTHPNGNPKLSDVDISALIELKLDAISAVGINKDGKINGISMGFCKVQDNNILHEEYLSKNLSTVEDYNYLAKVQEIEKELRARNIDEDYKEYAILVGRESQESLDELKELASACDIETVHMILQKGSKIDKSFYIGSGKVIELARAKQIRAANLIIFDEELSGIQIRNLEDNIGCRVIDRTSLILEIFARRARTKEAKIQVKLAELKYKGTRLIGFGTELSRIGGGLGNRGLGETKLELDRRKIKDEISNLKTELEKIKKIRGTQREKREKSNMGKISLVGYTNVGKSTLRNLIVKNYCKDNSNKTEDVFAENMLFATLDTTVRVVELKDKKEVAVIDTVGFIRKLPHDLVEAFKSTLEEVIFSDILIHVVDSSSENLFKEISVVEGVLKELGCEDKPTILALNKTDKISEEKLLEIEEKLSAYETVRISAKENINVDLLLEKAIEKLPEDLRKIEYIIPYTDTSVSAYIHNNSSVLSEEYQNEGIYIVAMVDEKVYNKCRKYEK